MNARPAATPVVQDVEAEHERQRRRRLDGKARMSACYEDLISFLEMNGLSGAYALALSGNGVEDLQQLLTLGDEGVRRLLQKCEFDAMDEILFLEALRTSRALGPRNR